MGSGNPLLRPTGRLRAPTGQHCKVEKTKQKPPPPPPARLSLSNFAVSLYTVVFFSLIITYRPDTSTVCLLLSVFLSLISSRSVRSFSWTDSAQTPSGQTPVAVIFLFITELNNYFQLLLLFDFSMLGVIWKQNHRPCVSCLTWTQWNDLLFSYRQQETVCRAFRSLDKINYVNALT